MDFVSIDFETANNSRSSACALGIVIVKNGTIVDEHYFLIDPEEDFDDYCIQIHGITSREVKGKPTFDALWASIHSHFSDGMIIAHNASFDLSVLRFCLDKSNITYPALKYFCTYILSKNMLSGLSSFRLDAVAEHFGINFKHHNALEDARTAALVMLKLMEIGNASGVINLSESKGCRSGELYNGGYKPFSLRSSNSRSYSNRIRSGDVTSENTEFDESHPLFGKTIAFTGVLSSMTRQESMQYVVDIGGICSDGVTKKVNYLVVGIRDFTKFRENEKSGKMKKAEEYISNGQDLEIVSEVDFLRMI
jgi:DNA polymerase-3 subunit epsilon